jgi:hypothetical protein
MGKLKSDAPDIKFTVPSGLTAAYIERINPAIGAAEANQLAVELHYIIYTYTSLFEARPPDSPREHASDLADATITLWRTALGLWVQDEDSGCAEESCWIADRLYTMDPTAALHLRWLRLCDRISDDNVAAILEQIEAEND